MTGALFGFNSVDFNSFGAPSLYSFTGFRNGVQAYQVTGTISSTGFSFGTYDNTLSQTSISALVIGVQDVNQSVNIDNISLAAVSSVPLPASAPMFGAALLALAAVGYGKKRKMAAAAA